MRTLISAKVTIDGGDWQDLKKIMPEWVINLLERRIDLSIVEKIKKWDENLDYESFEWRGRRFDIKKW